MQSWLTMGSFMERTHRSMAGSTRSESTRMR
jgi:hypothetical protein